MSEWIEVPGEPVPKERPRVGRGKRVYTPKRTAAYEEAVAYMAMASGRKHKGQVVVDMRFECADGRRGDLDNLVKSVLDGLQKGKLFKNDSQVCELHAWRVAVDANPKTLIRVRDFPVNSGNMT